MASQIQPDANSLSGLLTSSYDSMRDTIRLIRGSSDAQVAGILIIFSGTQLNEQVCQYVAVDGWVKDTMLGVRL